MKTWYVAILCVLFYGCQSVPVVPPVPVDSAMQKRFLSISQLRIGLTRQDVAGLLGQEVVTGYQLIDEKTEEYVPITVKNPHRIEMIRRDKKEYGVEYYLVGVKVADDVIGNDELVPVVYFNDKVVGVGWDFLDQLVKRSE